MDVQVHAKLGLNGERYDCLIVLSAHEVLNTGRWAHDVIVVALQSTAASVTLPPPWRRNTVTLIC